MKRFLLILAVMAIIGTWGCKGETEEDELIVKSITISPPNGGENVGTLTADIETKGVGQLQIEWHRGIEQTLETTWDYWTTIPGFDSVVSSCKLWVDSNQTYVSTLDSIAHGWYWIEITIPEDPLYSSQPIYSDSVACGQGSHTTPAIYFYAFEPVYPFDPIEDSAVFQQEYPDNGIYIHFHVILEDAYNACLYFGDGDAQMFSIHDYHIYDSAGVYTVMAIAKNLWAVEDTMIRPNYIIILPPDTT